MWGRGGAPLKDGERGLAVSPGRTGELQHAAVFIVFPSGRIQCHVCEAYNNFNCFNPVTCDSGDTYCVTAAVRE